MNHSVDFEACRQNMVESQIRTGGVVHPGILESFRQVPRELFVHPGQAGIAYGDEDLPLAEGRCLMEPLTHARLLSAAVPAPGDTAMVVGGAAGYAGAILSRLVANVVSLECVPEWTEKACALWSDLGCHNVIAHSADLAWGCPEKSPYSLIFINGGVSHVPQSLLDQLSIGGRLVAVVNDKPGVMMGQGRIIYRTSEDHFSERVLFDAAVPCLREFAPRREFAF